MNAANYTSPAAYAIGSGVSAAQHMASPQLSNQGMVESQGRGYLPNVLHNLNPVEKLPHELAGEFIDGLFKTVGNTGQQAVRGANLDAKLGERQLAQEVVTRNDMANGQATQSQLAQSQARLKQDTAREQHLKWFAPWLWGT